MSGIKSSKKGFTLYELTIVIALIAIIGTLIVTFVSYLTTYQNTVSEYNDSMSEIYLYKVSVEKWFSHFDTAEYKFTYAVDSSDRIYKLTATDSNNTTEYNAYYKESCIYLEYEKDSGYGTLNDTKGLNEFTINTEYISGITYELYEDTSNSDDSLIKCNVACPSGDVSFLLERHVVT